MLLSFVPAGLAQEAPYQDPGMKKIVEVAIVCRDAEASAKRWAAFLGFQPPKPGLTRPGKEMNLIYRGKPPHRLSQCRLFGARTGGPPFELMEPICGDTARKASTWTKHGESVNHIAFKPWLMWPINPSEDSGGPGALR